MPKFAIRTQEMFFLGMQNGYAFGKSGNYQREETLPEGWKAIWNKDGNWKIVDRWNSTGGHTQIMRGELVVWAMRYRGTYPKEVIPTLKAALVDRYQVGGFYGCRGPCFFQLPDESVWYENAWRGNFENFSGAERIVRLKQQEQPEAWKITEELGRHDYCGMMLID